MTAPLVKTRITLAHAEWLDGAAEILKHGDPNRQKVLKAAAACKTAAWKVREAFREAEEAAQHEH